MHTAPLIEWDQTLVFETYGPVLSLFEVQILAAEVAEAFNDAVALDAVNESYMIFR